MKKIYVQLSILAVLFLSTLTVLAQPGRLEGDFGAGWSNYDLEDRGDVKSVILMAGATNLNTAFLFNNANGDYNPQWTGSNAPNYVRDLNTFYDGGAFEYSSGDWNQNLETSITANRYYTFNIQDVASGNASMAVIETNFIPASINTVSQAPTTNIQSTDDVVVTVTLSAAPDAEEKVFVKYTADAWTTTNFVEILSFDGSFQGTATIPAQAASANVEYAVLSTKEATPDAASIDYLSLNVNNNSALNYSYSVEAGAPTASIVISDDGEITEGAEDGEVITIEVNDDTFAASLDIANWTITNLPTDVSAGSLTRLTDTTATITLSGNTSTDYDVDITDLTIEITNAEFVTLSSGSVSANSGVTFTAIVEVVTTPLWMHMLTSDSIGFEEGNISAQRIEAELGQENWNSFEIGYGTSNVDTAGWIWTTASWFADGTFPNKQVFAEITVPDVIGTYYYVARAKENAEDDWSYANNSTWTNTLTFAPEYKITVVASSAPTASIVISDDGEITEGAEDGEVITIEVNDDTFAASLDIANWTITNLPTDVTAGSLTRLTDTTATITLSGNTSADYDVDITDLTIEVTNAEFVTLSSGSVSANSGVTFTAIVEVPNIWMHMLTTDSIGFELGSVSAVWINAEIGQTTWDVSEIGYGTSNTDTAGWVWTNATWYEDGVGSNKRVHAEITVPDAIGTYYYVARAKADASHDWTYANNDSWTDGQAFAPEYKITVNDITTISNIDSESNVLFNVYPNPTKDVINIELKSELINKISISVKDVLGREIYSDKGLSDITKIDLSKYNNGVYIVELSLDSEKYSSIIIKK